MACKLDTCNSLRRDNYKMNDRSMTGLSGRKGLKKEGTATERRV